MVDDRQSGDTTEQAKANRRQLETYLAGLKASGAGLPCVAGRPDEVHWAGVARETGLPYSYFVGKGPGRREVDAALPRLGVAVRPRIQDEPTYRALQAHALDLRAREVAGQSSASQQMANLRSALQRVMREQGGSPNLVVGDALERFAAGLESRPDPTSRKLRSEVSRLIGYLAKMGGEQDLPDDFAGALQAAIRRSGQTGHALAARLGVKWPLIHKWATGARVPDERNLHIVTALEDCLGLEPKSLINKIRRRRHGQGRYPAHL